jgi:hypothetical protein
MPEPNLKAAVEAAALSLLRIFFYYLLGNDAF